MAERFLIRDSQEQPTLFQIAAPTISTNKEDWIRILVNDMNRILALLSGEITLLKQRVTELERKK